jgi:hypothetical protein
MRQLSNIFRVCAVAVEKMTFVDDFTQLSSFAIIISRTQFYNFIANSRSWNNYNRNLVLNTNLNLINNIENSISNENARYFASTNTFSSFLTLSYLYASIYLELNLTSPLQILVWIIYLDLKLLNKKRWVWPLASYVPST